MNIGIPKEIKSDEQRVALTPAAVSRLIKEDNKVFIERGAGLGSGYSDVEYKAVGAHIIKNREDIYAKSDFIIKIKEPVESEYHLLREGQIIFTFLHLSASKTLTDVLLNKKVVGIAYETVQTPNGDLPLLAPMSEIAGRMAPMVASQFLMQPYGKRGVLISGVPGVPEAHVSVIGAGYVGINAVRIARGLGARVTALDKNLRKLRYLEDLFSETMLTTITSDEYSIKSVLNYSDIIILSVLQPGAKAPTIISREMLKYMKPGSVIVDVSIDQGGAAETSRPTTHHDPVFEVDGIMHYCVSNMPGAVPRTSTKALSMITIDYISEIASKGWRRAALENKAIMRGLNVVYGEVTHPAVAQTFNYEYVPFASTS